MLDGYEFPVYTTEFCPRNETEWKERSSVFNCTPDSTYACFPNNDITELIEFCYPLKNILIPAGFCLFLSKTRSKVDAYDCRTFDYGCPKSYYTGSTIFKYPSCVSIAHGCFLAEVFCESSSTSIIQETTTEKPKHGVFPETSPSQHTVPWYIWILIASLIGFITACCYLLFSKYRKKNFRGTDKDLCNEEEFNPLLRACQNGKDVTVQLFLINGADVNLCNKNGLSPLILACENGHYSTVKLLLNNGAENYFFDENGLSPLNIVCYNGHSTIVQLLLNNGADVNLCNKNGFSPLYLACQNGHDNTVKLLLNNGADVNLCNKNGLSPLYSACQNGHDSTVKLLLDNGAWDNVFDEIGFSPLKIACYSGHSNIVQLLLSNGADVNLCNKKGFSPLYSDMPAQ